MNQPYANHFNYIVILQVKTKMKDRRLLFIHHISINIHPYIRHYHYNSAYS